MTKTAKKLNFTEAMEQLEEINRWFQEEDIDLEKALEKLKEGKELLNQCRAQLKEVENEFVEIREDFED